MNRLTGAALLGVGLAFTAPACGGEGSRPKPNVVEIGDITTDDCEMLAEIYYPDTEKEREEETRIDRIARDFQQADNFAIDGDLEAATTAYRNSKAEVMAAINPDSQVDTDDQFFSQEDAWSLVQTVDTFLADPEGTQSGLIAQCAAFAGETLVAEAALDEIKSPSTRRAWEDRTENWQVFTAVQLAEDEKFDEAYKILPLIDDEGNNTNESAHEDVENQIEFNATNLAQDAEIYEEFDQFEEALELAERADTRGDITEESIRDIIEVHIADAAAEAAGHYYSPDREELEAAIDLADSIDGAGDFTRAVALDAVEAEVLETAKELKVKDYAEARELIDLIDGQGEVTHDTALSDFLAS